MRAALLPFLAIFPMVTGCHVVERSKQCGRLAAVMSEAAPELNGTEVGKDPESKTLRKKSRLFGQLADQLQEVAVTDPKVREEKKNLVDHLKTLEKNFKDAASAVDEEKKYQKRQKNIRARAKKKKAEGDKGKRSDESKSEAKAGEAAKRQPPLQAIDAEPKLKVGTPKFPGSHPKPFDKAPADKKTMGKAAAKKAAAKKAAAKKAAGKKAAGKKAKKPAKPQSAAPRTTVHSRRYGRLKRSIEATLAEMNSTKSRLEKACR